VRPRVLGFVSVLLGLACGKEDAADGSSSPSPTAEDAADAIERPEWARRPNRMGAGRAHACVIDRGDRVVCWGDRFHGHPAGLGRPERSSAVYPIDLPPP
jgi:hypothetical protein